MPKRTLSEHRPWLFASILAAIGYFFLEDARIGGLFLILLKGAGVGLLAVYALRRSSNTDARLLGVVMVLSSLGDMALELTFEIGGALFFASHLFAIALYLRNRRSDPAASQKLAALGLLVGTPLIAWLFTQSGAVALYSAGLGTMAATAWLSRFPRYRVGTGAALFVASDLLIFARMGGRLDGTITAWLVWPLYYCGQFLITTGIVQTLRREPTS